MAVIHRKVSRHLRRSIIQCLLSFWMEQIEALSEVTSGSLDLEVRVQEENIPNGSLYARSVMTSQKHRVLRASPGSSRTTK
jgi:hypothetical protein